jgi:hypothetical protein
MNKINGKVHLKKIKIRVVKMKEKNSKILSQKELETAKLDIMSNVMKSISGTDERVEFDENFGTKLSNSINDLVDNYANNLSQDKRKELVEDNLDLLQSKSYFPNVTEIISVPYNEKLNGINLFENNVPFEVAKDITEKGKRSEHFDEYFSDKDKVKFLLNIRDLSNNSGEYLSRETFSEEKYVEEQEKYGKFLLTECFKDLISDNVLEKLNNGKDYLEKEDIEVIIEDISKEKKNLDLKYEDKLNEEKNEKSEKSTNNKRFDYEEIKEKNDKGREYDF